MLMPDESELSSSKRTGTFIKNGDFPENGCNDFD
jgi:hypothetical protein